MDTEWHTVDAPNASVTAFAWVDDNTLVLNCDRMPNVRLEGIKAEDYELLQFVNSEAPKRTVDTIEALLHQATDITVPSDASHRPILTSAASFRFPCDGCGQHTLHKPHPQQHYAECLRCGYADVFVKRMACPDCQQDKTFVNVGTYNVKCVECGKEMWDR